MLQVHSKNSQYSFHPMHDPVMSLLTFPVFFVHVKDLLKKPELKKPEEKKDDKVSPQTISLTFLNPLEASTYITFTHLIISLHSTLCRGLNFCRKFCGYYYF